VLDEAVAPSSPSYPKPLLNLIAGLFLGFIIGVALAMLRELLDDRVSSTDEVERKLGLTGLGEIPLIRGLNEPALIASLDDPDSELGIHYSAFRTALLFSTRRGLPKSVAITSSGEGEGKSTTALATARSLASAGKHVLLIEADMRHASLTDLLQLNEAVGLSAVLTGQVHYADAIQKSDHPGLDVISAGPLPPNPADILDPERIRAILDCASNDYDCVVIDAPPVADLGDAALIAAAAENVIFVVAANKHHRGRAKASLRRLRATGATILGAVLTKAPSRGMALYGYGYHRGSLKRLGTRRQGRMAAA
jgi:capsular exopolysaccharide synthesis family protein